MPPPPPHELEKGNRPHPPLPPHERRKRGLGKRLFLSVIAGVMVTVAVSIWLWFFGISVNVILPVAAPIVVGSTTLAYNVLADRI